MAEPAGAPPAHTLRVGGGRRGSLEVLSEIARLLNSRADVESAFDEVLRLVTELLGLRTAWLFLLRPPGRRLLFSAAHGLPPALEVGERRPLRHGTCDCFYLFYEGALREAVNVVECSRLQAAEGDRCGLVYHASVPLRSSSGILGVLNVAAEGETLFDDDALSLLTAVGEHLGTALERSRLFSNERRRAAAFEAVDRIVRRLGELEPDAPQAVEAVARRFAEACLQVLDVDVVSVAVAATSQTQDPMTVGSPAGAPAQDDGLRLVAVSARSNGSQPLEAGWTPGHPVPRRSVLWASWRAGRAHFGHSVPRRAPPARPGALARPGSWAALPVMLGRRRLGAIMLERAGVDPWIPVEQAALRSLADHLALAFENARLVARARELARIEERHRLSRDLHDAVSQNLFSLSMLLAAGREHLQAGRAAEAALAVEEAQARAKTALAEMRRLVTELRPHPAFTVCRVGELATRLRELARSEPLARRLGVEVRVATGRLDRGAPLAQDGAEALLRVAQEATHNALKHAAPRRVRLWLGQSGGALRLVVSDDGRGFDVRQAGRSGGRGLSIMEERCRLAGGGLRIESRPGRGTRVTAWVPLDGPPVGRNG